MATALIVDDSLVDQRLAGHALEKDLGLTVEYAANGRAAIRAIQQRPPDIVVTDMQMPEMDGLELVETLRRDHPTLPVVLMTAVGSEELAAAALRGGASGYVPKRHLHEDLVRVVNRQLMLANCSQRGPVIDFMHKIQTDFVLNNDIDQIAPVIRYLKDDLLRIGMFSETTVMNIGLALEEAVTN
ncbi:MAG: response regulator, partial [Planctomycetes bacterium]|nr:response regulator [Planctomycetota bacterium]